MEENIDSTKIFKCVCAFRGKPIKMEIQEKNIVQIAPIFQHSNVYLFAHIQANIKRIVCDGDTNGHHYARQKDINLIGLNEEKV